MHGGKAPQAIRSARQRLQELAEPAIEALRVALENGNAHCVIRAAIAVLDRTGYGPSSKLAVEEVTSRDSSYVRWLDNTELETISMLTSKAKARQDAGEPPRDSPSARSACGQKHP